MTILTLLTLPLVAMTSGTPRHHTPEATVDSSQMTLVTVQNDDSRPVRVEMQNSWGDYELGTVPANGVVSLQVPQLLIDDGVDVDFFIVPKGGFEQDSGYMELHRGDHVGLLVPNR